MKKLLALVLCLVGPCLPAAAQTPAEPTTVSVPVPLLTQVFNYLGTRPYGEVKAMEDGLLAAAQAAQTPKPAMASQPPPPAAQPPVATPQAAPAPGHPARGPAGNPPTPDR